jgi:hypothetical protein
MRDLLSTPAIEKQSLPMIVLPNAGKTSFLANTRRQEPTPAGTASPDGRPFAVHSGDVSSDLSA